MTLGKPVFFCAQKEKPPVKARRSGAHYDLQSSSLISRLSKKGLSKRLDVGVANSAICIYIISNLSMNTLMTNSIFIYRTRP